MCISRSGDFRFLASSEKFDQQRDGHKNDPKNEETSTESSVHFPTTDSNGDDAANEHSKEENHGDEQSVSPHIDGTLIRESEKKPWNGQPNGDVENIGSNRRRYSHIGFPLFCNDH
mmetsp:Transcript_8269/g.13394  ORF Transcript_8269/g.13394 Transcript_8269/m.13394 type:complete len:116 (+) Transcript_8269:131-478(+)